MNLPSTPGDDSAAAEALAWALAESVFTVSAEEAREIIKHLADHGWNIRRNEVTDAMVEAAIEQVDFTWPESREHMRAAIAAALAAKGTT